jgi:putative ABC transport system substrate-binding protein
LGAKLARFVLALAGFFFVFPPATFAQTARVGFLGSESAVGYAPLIEALRAGLRERGYVEGKNLTLEFRWAEGKYERLNALAAELAAGKVDVIVTHGTPGTRAAQQSAKGLPIVMATSGDAVASGLIASLARPGGNTTGLTALNHDMMGKRLEMLKLAVPHLTRAGVLVNANNPAVNASLFQATAAAARALDLGLQRFDVRGKDDFENAAASMARAQVKGFTMSQEGLFLGNANRLVAAALANGLAMAGGKEFAEAGALIGYGPDFVQMYRHAAVFVDKLLKGAKPGDLPVEQPTRFELIVNLKTAAALGLRIPQELLLRADRVIE